MQFALFRYVYACLDSLYLQKSSMYIQCLHIYGNLILANFV